jgi:hypothetical protein
MTPPDRLPRLPSDDPVTLRGTQQEERVVAGQPRYSLLDHQTNTVVTFMSNPAVPMPSARDEQKFRQLADRWRMETRALSSDSDIVANFAYHQIIGMGERALPLIFDEMRAHGGRWYWALRAITGENPVRLEDRGNVRRMTETWLEWARRHNYV